ncbi:NfeD family protein [Paenibacillus agricola]|uniref:NfeD-like C-terminal domain-containing protein n=1 Tax=Paenibacillus agricola TaxID=2716264 RepID=A0ABX0J545_9BACL|nr:NfeD family protein [Paenibacillus agricola]NHN30936.1 hypothetical protein [Paenibacillus agricola]
MMVPVQHGFFYVRWLLLVVLLQILLTPFNLFYATTYAFALKSMETVNEPTLLENTARFISQRWVGVVLLAMLIGGLLVRFALRSNRWKLSLDNQDTDSGYQQGYESIPQRTDLLGQSGLAITPLRPSGTIQVADEWVHVVTYGEFIAINKQVVIVEVEGSRIIVREADERVH